MREFYGYRRPDGRVGIRNYVLILPASACASDVTNKVAAEVKGAVSFHNQQGCSQMGRDFDYTMNVLAGFAANPNVYGTILVGLGCENCQIDLIKAEIDKRTSGKPFFMTTIQDEGGTIKCMEKVTRIAREMVAEASMVQKEKFPISEIVLGTECGGSDPTSGIAANPTIGALSDKLIADGGTSILSETTEFIGGEQILAARAVNQRVHDRVLEIVDRYEKHFHNVGADARQGNPSPGNKEGGLTTLEEKSLGCIHKGGESPVQEVYEYGENIPKEQKGLVIMDTPGNDPSSMAGMIAGGCQVVVFSSGRGTAMGTPLVPVIKITGNKFTYANMVDNIDFDASRYISGEKTIDEQADELYDILEEVANGKFTKAEALGFTEMAIARQCNYA